MSTPVTIAQDPEQSKLAYSLQRKANIDLIGLKDVVANCKRDIQGVTLPLKFGLHYQPEKTSVTDQKLTSLVEFTLRIVDDKDIDAVFFKCVFRADYDLAEGYQPSQEEIEAFTQSNAVFNCWPYFRELAQSTLTRMNYPPLSIPFMRLAPKPPPTKRAPTQARLIDDAKPTQAPDDLSIGVDTGKRKRRVSKDK